MAEFCLEHFNQLFEKALTEKEVEIALDFCESCGEIKPCVMYIKKSNVFKEIILKIKKENRK